MAIVSQKLEDRTLLSATVGVYDENVVQPNRVDFVAAGSSLSNFQFAANVATAFQNNSGGVIDATLLGLDYQYGVGQSKTLNLVRAGGTNFGIGAPEPVAIPISGRGAFATGSSSTPNLTSIDFALVNALPDEQVIEFGVTALAYLNRDYGNVTVTGRLAVGGSLSAAQRLAGSPGRDDTFFGLTAPAGDFFTGFSIGYDGPVFGQSTTSLWFDDLGFRTGLVTSPDPTLRLTIAANAIAENAGAAATTATIARLNTDTRSPLTVALASSDSTEATVPATVTIPAGALSATFNIDAVDDRLLDGTQTAVVTASAAGFTSSIDAVDVTDHETLSLTIRANAIRENSGSRSTIGFVQRSNLDDLGSELVVNLSSGDTTEATLPATVTIPAGSSRSPFFNVSAVDDNLLDGTQTVVSTSSAGGYVNGIRNLLVFDHETLTVDIAAASISENAGAGATTGRVIRSNIDDLGSSLVVSLSSDDPSEATVPASVTIPAGSASVTFPIAAVNDAIADGTQTVTITASETRYVSIADTINVTDEGPVAVDDVYSVDENGVLRTSAFVAESDLVLRYGFDESDAGTTAALDSGYGPSANGTFSGFAGRVGTTPGSISTGALDLTGGTNSNNFVTAGDADKVDVLSEMTMTLWVNLRSDPNSGDRLISDITGGTSTGFDWRITQPFGGGLSASNFSLGFRIADVGSFSSTSGGIYSADKQWAFLALTLDTSRNLAIYNGNETSVVGLSRSATMGRGLPRGNGADLRVGGTAAEPTTDHAPPAWFDDVRIYDRALPLAELEAVRQQGLAQLFEPGVMANDRDSLTAVLVSGPSNGSLDLNADGSFKYTPNANFNGTDQFTYKTRNPIGESNVATVTITVKPTNVAPVARDDAYIIDEDAILNIAVAGVLANDTDIDGDTLKSLLVSGPSNGTLVLGTDGSFKYTPNTNFNGSDSFKYKANDGTVDSNIATVTITVKPTNDAPVATNDAFNVDEDAILNIAAAGVLANDTDIDGDTLKSLLVSGPSNGTLTLNVDGSFKYTPNTNFNGSDSFKYKANDGTVDSNIATVTITVKPVNDAPVATNDAYNVDEDAILNIAAAGVLANDTDIDGDALKALLVSGPSNGTLVLGTDGSFKYTPNTNFNGSDSFKYKANDGTVDSNIATVSITVKPTNDAPVATNDAYNVDEDAILNITAAGVLVNDTDIDGDTLKSLLVSSPSNGTLTLNADGSFKYTPNANFNGSDSFKYKANDGSVDSNIATVTITVKPTNDAPVAKNDAYNVDEDAILNIAAAGVLANDTDIDGDALKSLLVSGPSNGTLTLNADGSFKYTPNANFNGNDSFQYKANDGTVDSNVATVTIRVNPMNDAPTLGDRTFSIAENSANGTLVGTVQGFDVDGDTLTYGIIAGNGSGAFAINATTGAITVADSNQLDFETMPTFVLTVRTKDPAGLFDDATVTILLKDVDETIQVSIDIRPGDADNEINIKSNGKINVAILSTANFDARTVDVNSLTFGRTGDEDSLSKRGRGVPRFRFTDVNGDGLLDIVVTFEIELTNFQLGDTLGILKGKTTSGLAIRGQQSVRIKRPGK